MNSRKKGADGERELARVLAEYGYKARRGQQYSGANGDADVVGLPDIHIECKRVERLNIDKALQQAVDDAYADSIAQGKRIRPAVFHRANDDRKRGSTKGTWKVTMALNDWMWLYKAAETTQKQPKNNQKTTNG